MLKHLFFCTIAVLAVPACAPGGGEEKDGDKPSSAPFGYEFAQAHDPSIVRLDTADRRRTAF
ncbi:hypothetical protein EH31_16360 [Erythrobacter longus]|uniref:Uncharacterized protein n=1 Tax=Erythrobacter longus TaxID=1044 RepID=A0A074M233_ERYLO|nr:hypothetical protein [Erythrobacter longus]KEO88531.1 hypothetical protein EH31_16360 [Erythrobacter longus]